MSQERETLASAERRMKRPWRDHRLSTESNVIMGSVGKGGPIPLNSYLTALSFVSEKLLWWYVY